MKKNLFILPVILILIIICSCMENSNQINSKSTTDIENSIYNHKPFDTIFVNFTNSNLKYTYQANYHGTNNINAVTDIEVSNGFIVITLNGTGNVFLDIEQIKFYEIYSSNGTLFNLNIVL